MNSDSLSPEYFKTLTEELSSLLENEGMAVRPYAHSSISFYQQLSAENQKETIRGLEDYLETSHRVLRAGRSLKQNQYFITTALDFFGFQTHPDFDQRILNYQGVVEFYSLGGIQIFRTFNYFELTSYTLEEIYCRPWNYLYERDDAITKKMFEDIESVIVHKDLEKTIFVEPHTIKERLSLERLEIGCEGMHISPLVKYGEIVGMAALTSFKR